MKVVAGWVSLTQPAIYLKDWSAEASIFRPVERQRGKFDMVPPVLFKWWAGAKPWS